MFEVSYLILLASLGGVLAVHFSKARVNIFEPFLLTTVLFILFYLVPLLYYYLYPEIYPLLDPSIVSQRIPLAAFVVALLYLSIAFGYALGRSLRITNGEWSRVRGDFPKDIDAVGLIVFFYCLAWISRIVLIYNGQYFQSVKSEVDNVLVLSYANILSEFYIVAVVLAGIRYKRSLGTPTSSARQLKAARRLFYGMLVLEFLFAVPSGRKEAVLLIPLIVIFLNNFYGGYFRPRKIVVYGGAGFLIVVAYFAVNQVYRWAIEVIVMNGGTVDLGNMAQVFSLIREGTEMLGNLGGAPDKIFDGETILFSVLGRIGGLVEPLVHILEVTPSQIDYKYGATLNVLVEFIPRLLWPEKPVTVIGNTLGREYGILSPTDYATNISFGLAGEAYLNFGLAGIVGIGIVLGFTMRRVYRSLIVQNHGDYFSLLLYFLFMYWFIGRIHVGISGTLVGFVKIVVIIFIVRYALIRGRLLLERATVGARVRSASPL